MDIIHISNFEKKNPNHYVFKSPSSFNKNEKQAQKVPKIV
jgi:hypothetical protein